MLHTTGQQAPDNGGSFVGEVSRGGFRNQCCDSIARRTPALAFLAEPYSTARQVRFWDSLVVVISGSLACGEQGS